MNLTAALCSSLFVSLVAWAPGHDAGREGVGMVGAVGRVVVVGEALGGCNCKYDVELLPGGVRNACVMDALRVHKSDVLPECDLDQGDCRRHVPCKGSYEVDVQIVNWAACCPGAPFFNMNLCLNGRPIQIIPNGNGGVFSVRVDGTELVCQAHSNSPELRSKTDRVTVTCGFSCNTGGLNPLVVLRWEGTYREHCDACPEGSHGGR